MIYEVINPSDNVTFLADDDKVAYFCVVYLSEGAFGCYKKLDNGDTVNLNTMLMFHKNPIAEMQEFLGCPVEDFIEQNKEKIAECYESFSYATYESRKLYDQTVAAITDPQKLKDFKMAHEDNCRSSCSRIVMKAWNLAEGIKKRLPEQKES